MNDNINKIHNILYNTNVFTKKAKDDAKTFFDKIINNTLSKTDKYLLYECQCKRTSRFSTVDRKFVIFSDICVFVKNVKNVKNTNNIRKYKRNSI